MSLLNHLIPSFNRTAGTAEANDNTDAPTVRPVYTVNETDAAYDLTVYLPGVSRDGLELTAEADAVRVSGRRQWTAPAGWTARHRESADAHYELVLTHENEVEADKISAELKDGVLRVTLPKAESLKPRKIAVA